MMVLQRKVHYNPNPVISAAIDCPTNPPTLSRQMLRILPIIIIITAPTSSVVHKESQGCKRWHGGNRGAVSVAQSDACLSLYLKPWFTATIKVAQAGGEERERETERVSVYWVFTGLPLSQTPLSGQPLFEEIYRQSVRLLVLNQHHTLPLCHTVSSGVPQLKWKQ